MSCFPTWANDLTGGAKWASMITLQPTSVCLNVVDVFRP